MAHITLPANIPGIGGPMAYRPDAAKHLRGLAETILRQPASLEPAEHQYEPMGRRLRDQGYAPPQ